MLKNNIRQEAYDLRNRSKGNLTEIAAEMGVSKQYISQVLNRGNNISEVFVEILDRLGYDVEIKYIDKETGKTFSCND